MMLHLYKSTVKILLISFVCFTMLDSKAQTDFCFDFSLVSSNFKFVDSDNNVDKKFNSNLTSGLNLGVARTLKNGFVFGGNLGYRGAGASIQIGGMNFNWDFKYADVKVILGYRLDKWRIRPFVTASPYYAFLLKATQTNGTVVYNNLENNSVSKSDFGLIGTGGLNMKISDEISMYAAYNYIYGIKNIQMEDNQELYNRGYSITFGLAFTISKSSPKWVQQ